MLFTKMGSEGLRVPAPEMVGMVKLYTGHTPYLEIGEVRYGLREICHHILRECGFDDIQTSPREGSCGSATHSRDRRLIISLDYSLSPEKKLNLGVTLTNPSHKDSNARFLWRSSESVLEGVPLSSMTDSLLTLIRETWKVCNHV